MPEFLAIIISEGPVRVTADEFRGGHTGLSMPLRSNYCLRVM